MRTSRIRLTGTTTAIPTRKSAIAHQAAGGGLLLIFSMTCCGCFDWGLPPSTNVAVKVDAALLANRGSGAPALANSTWAVYEDYGLLAGPEGTPAPDGTLPGLISADQALLARIEFGPNGEIKRIFDSRLNREALPDTLLPDGFPHPGNVPFTTYVAAPYSGQVEPDIGVVTIARLFLGPTEIGRASIWAFGELNGGRIVGQFGITGLDLADNSPTGRRIWQVVAVREPIQPAPFAIQQSVFVGPGETKTIELSGDDPDDKPLTFAIVAGPEHGTLGGTPPSVTYTPTPGYSGPDSFSFKASNGSAESNTALGCIAVLPVPGGRMVWQALGSLSDAPGGPQIETMIVHDGRLIAGGFGLNARSNGQGGFVGGGSVAAWDGQQWESLGSPGEGLVYSLAVWNDQLFAGSQTGVFGLSGGQWEPLGGNWAQMQCTMWGGSSAFQFSAFTAYRGHLIAAGYCMTSMVPFLLSWDGTSWTEIGTFSTAAGWQEAVTSLAVYHDELIVAGAFTHVTGIEANYIARWDGASWKSLGAGLNSPADSLVVYDDELIAGGRFTQAGETAASGIARWDGSLWRPLRRGLARADGLNNGPSGGAWVRTLAVHSGELIVGGHIDYADGLVVGNIARWNGQAWQTLGGGVGNPAGTSISAAMTYNGDLIVGGIFEEIGGVAAENLARWTVAP